MIPHIFNGNGTISLMIDNVMKPIDTAHKYYNEIRDALKAQDWDVIPGLVNIKEQVEQAINASTVNGTVTIDNGEVFYNGTRIHNSLTDRIIDMAREGFDIAHMVKFLENLMENPSYRAVNELYDFLEVGAIPITENGTFLTYKKIRSDWKDIHSGRFDNSIGAIAKMPRNMVNEDSSQTCSAGLHVCSYDYLPHFGRSGDDRVVICEVNPRDVVSIPTDYNNTKMRVCEYTVIGEVKNYSEEDILAKNAVMFTSDVAPPQTPSFGSVGIDAKNLGKAVTEALENGDIDSDDLETILRDSGLSNWEAQELEGLADNEEYKRVGKKVARFITNGDINATTLAENLESYACEEDEDNNCERCGALLSDDDEECPECGYYP